MKLKEAYTYYKKHILNENKRKLFAQYSFPPNGMISSQDWELFAAILFNKKKQSQGSDLGEYEIKSAKKGSSFEYQYHKNCGLKKLAEDQKVNHVYISYDNNYEDIIVRKIAGKKLSPLMQEWKQELDINYKSGKQRFRKNIPYTFVIKNAEIIFMTKNGKVEEE